VAAVNTQRLEVEHLEVSYHLKSGRVRALDDVSFTVEPGEILGIVGESGCGKSTLTSALMRLLPANGEITGGRIALGGRDITHVSSEEMRQLRGAELAMIFQDPLTSLNPVFQIGRMMIDAQKAHTRTLGSQRGHEMRTRAVAALAEVGIPDPSERIASYPHEFSGGMRQRIMIATALMLQPSILIADEPTSALDVTLEAQILALMRRLREAHGTTLLFVSHDLAVVSQLCDRVVVMYAGRVVEENDVVALFEEPRHPYTRALLASVPSYRRRGRELASIPGRVPSLADLPAGCKFVNRCPWAQGLCAEDEPRLASLDSGKVRCARWDPKSGYDTDSLPASASRRG
jgi:peptide/nickel transport system ATP-binding protein